MKQYLDGLKNIMENGVDAQDRTGVGTRSVFGMCQRYNLKEGFPAVTTKKLAWKSVVSELLWFLEGSGDERRLAEILYGKPRDQLQNKTTIWTANANAEYWINNAKFPGDLGTVYGKLWREYPTVNGHIDQVSNLLSSLKNDPYGRRHIIDAWHPGLGKTNQALPPCHVMAQFYIRNNTLSCSMLQRSSDDFLGKPFNIASYSLLTHMIAHVLNLEVGDFVHYSNDCHVYFNHFDVVKEQLEREPLPLPTLWLNPDIKDLFSFTMDDIKLIDYQHHSTLTAPMAV